MPQTSAVPAPPSAAGPIAVAGGGGLDGVYRSPTGPVSGNARCGTTTFGYPIRVTNGVANLHTNTAGDFSGPIAPDGSLMIEHGRQMLQGKFSGNQFTGSLSYNSCSFALNYFKR